MFQKRNSSESDYFNDCGIHLLHECRYALRGRPSVEISREAFDKHYGSLQQFGSFKRKAARSKGTLAQATRPARGRKSTRKASPAEQEQAFNRLEQRRKEQRIESDVAKKRKRKIQLPKRITLSMWGWRKSVLKIECPLEYEALESLRKLAQASKIVWSYWVNLEFVDENGDDKEFAIFGARHISQRILKGELNEAIRSFKKSNGSYRGELVGCTIAFKLTSEAQKRNGIDNPR